MNSLLKLRRVFNLFDSRKADLRIYKGKSFSNECVKYLNSKFDDFKKKTKKIHFYNV